MKLKYTLFILSNLIIFSNYNKNGASTPEEIIINSLKKSINLIFDDSDKIQSWDSKILNEKKAAWNKSLKDLELFIIKNGNKSDIEKFEKYIYAPYKTVKDDIAWTDNLSQDIFNKIGTLIYNMNFTDRNPSFSEIDKISNKGQRLNNFLKSFYDRATFITKQIKDGWFTKSTISHKTLISFMNDIIFPLIESIRSKYIKAINAKINEQEKQRLEKEKSELEISKRKAKELAEIKIKEPIEQQIKKLEEVLKFETGKKSFFDINTPLYEAIKGLKNLVIHTKNFNTSGIYPTSLIDISDKIFNLASNLVSFAEKKNFNDFASIFEKLKNINQELADAEKLIFRKEIVLSENSSDIYKFVISKLRLLVDTIIASFSKIIPTPPKETKKEIIPESKPSPDLPGFIETYKKELKKLKIPNERLQATTITQFQKIYVDINNIIIKMESLPEQLKSLKEAIESNPKESANKKNLLVIYNVIKAEIVRLNKEIDRLEVKPDTQEQALKIQFQQYVGEKYMQWGTLGNLLEQIVNHFGLKKIIDETKKQSALESIN